MKNDGKTDAGSLETAQLASWMPLELVTALRRIEDGRSPVEASEIELHPLADELNKVPIAMYAELLLASAHLIRPFLQSQPAPITYPDSHVEWVAALGALEPILSKKVRDQSERGRRSSKSHRLELSGNDRMLIHTVSKQAWSEVTTQKKSPGWKSFQALAKKLAVKEGLSKVLRDSVFTELFCRQEVKKHKSAALNKTAPRSSRPK